MVTMIKPTDSLRPPRSLAQVLHDLRAKRDLAAARGVVAASMGAMEASALAWHNVMAYQRRIDILKGNSDIEIRRIA
jgi:hypothetical protein